MDIEDAIGIIVSNFGISKKELLIFLNKDTPIEKSNIIMPYYGVIFDERCKGIVFNRGLYTQCTKICKTLCKDCKKNKYGSIYERNNYDIGKFKLKTGKMEIPYDKFIKKMNYDIDEVKRQFLLCGLDFDKLFKMKESKTRGRPRKVDIEVEVEVLEVEVEGMYYYKTRENVLLDIESYEIVGMLKKDKIEKYF